MFQHIKDFVELDDSGPKAWKLLRDLIQPNTLPMVIVLEKVVAALSMRLGDDVKPVLDKIKDTYARMAAAGSNVSQMQQCTKIISVLVNSWDNLIPTLNTQQDQWTPEWLRQQILQEDFRRRHTGGGAANTTAEGYGAAGGSRGRGGGRGRGRGRGFGRGRGRGDYNEGHGSSGGKGSTRMEGACWYCKNAGHPWFKCFSRPEGWAPPGMKPPNGERARGGAVQGSGAQDSGAQGKANTWMFLMVEDVKGSEAKAPLALVHMDVVGPTRAPSLSGSRYFLTIVDDHTRAVWVYPLKTKGEVAAAVLKEWMPRAQRESGHKVKVICTDNGGEFMGDDFESVLKKKWIQHQLTVPYNPQQNGVAERFNWTLQEGACTLLGRVGLPDPFGQQLTVSRDVKFLESLYYKEWKKQQHKLPPTSLIIEADEVQQPSRQVQVTVSEEEISGVTEDGGEPEVEEEEQQQQQQDAPQAEALSGPDAEKWKQSVKEEYDSLLENETWELCELPPGKKAISSKLIFRHKYGPDGELTCYKSRLVAKGFQQIKGKDFDEIFALVGKGTTLRAPRAWYHKLEETLLAGGFKKSECDHSLFLLQEKEQFLMLLVYVDDILLFSKSSAMIEHVEEMLEMQLKCSKMGDVNYYLGMHVERDLDKGVLRLHQRRNCEGLVEKYGLQDGGKPATPLSSGFTVEPCADEEVVGESDRKLFHSMSAVKLAKNACLHKLTKHIRPKWHWVRRLLDKEVRLEIVKTHQQAADILAKRLAESEHWKGMKLAGISGRAVGLDVWVDDLQLFLHCDSRDGVSLFDHMSGVSTAPAATADGTVRSQWTTRDAVARLALRNHLPPAERAHFGKYKTAQSLYDAVVARYSSPSTAALSCLMLPYLFPDLAAFATVADLVAVGATLRFALSCCPCACMRVCMEWYEGMK
ncbi:unnamed protein product [Closterium sp. NIES-53]